MSPSPDYKNMILAIVLSMAVIFGWQYFIELPRMQAQQAAEAAKQATSQGDTSAGNAGQGAGNQTGGNAAIPADKAAELLPRAEAIAANPRIAIDTPRLSGSIDLLGGRIDDLTLKGYRETVDPQSPLVILLSPAKTAQSYFADTGWVGDTPDLPNAETLWQADGDKLTVDRPITLTWTNGAGLSFQRKISIDENYLFTIEDKVTNQGSGKIALSPYSRVVRVGAPQGASQTYVLHEGPIAVLDGTLEEESYGSVKSLAQEADPANPASGLHLYESQGGWLGITDKYWLVAGIAPNDEKLSARVFYDPRFDSYQADYTGAARDLAPGATVTIAHRLFAGAKEVKVLEDYRDRLEIPLFERAVDFGWFFFLTKPFFYLLDFLNKLIGNFGIAILCLTVIVKLAMFPLANKSYRSMNRMKALQPQMMALKESCADDKARFQRELMALYKREKVNPAAGCLPIVVQIPVFYALYKVLYVTIEMRHAPFFGWIRDLSAIDPTNVLNLFGLLPWEPSAYIGIPIIGTIIAFLSIGVWPLVMGFTMWAQMRLNPTPPDPIQARIMGFMPILFTFMLAHFPAGLVIYWSWNNLLSIGQQKMLMRSAAPKPAKT